MWRDLVISQDFCLTAVLLQLSLYFLLVLQAPPPKSSPNLHKCTLTPDCPRKRERLAKRWQLAIAASRLAVSLAKKNFKKILWDQGSTNEPARRLGGLWRPRDFLYSHCSDTLIFCILTPSSLSFSSANTGSGVGWGGFTAFKGNEMIKEWNKRVSTTFVPDCRLDRKKYLESAGRSRRYKFSLHVIYWFIQIFTILFSHCPQIAKASLGG